jgi:catechol 2,3-dioxygenase-like lactoylglutathione lyase family enzyme
VSRGLVALAGETEIALLALTVEYAPARFARHVLRVDEPETLADFYAEHFGLVRRSGEPARRVVLCAGRQEEVALELRRGVRGRYPGPRFDHQEGYWKIGFSVPALDAFRRRLVSAGVEVGSPVRFEDVGYLCHLRDPEGYPIELLECGESVERDAVTNRAVLAHVTLRIRDPEASIRFYCEGLGLRLLSRQPIRRHGFTLYFLAATTEASPEADLESARNREWLWRRPHTCLELQHFWGEKRPRRPYRLFDAEPRGFWGLGFEVRDLERLLRDVGEKSIALEEQSSGEVLVRDPDGYLVRCVLV